MRTILWNREGESLFPGCFASGHEVIAEALGVPLKLFVRAARKVPASI